MCIMCMQGSAHMCSFMSHVGCVYPHNHHCKSRSRTPSSLQGVSLRPFPATHLTNPLLQVSTDVLSTAQSRFSIRRFCVGAGGSGRKPTWSSATGFPAQSMSPMLTTELSGPVPPGCVRSPCPYFLIMTLIVTTSRYSWYSLQPGRFFFKR